MNENKRQSLVASVVYFLWLIWTLFCLAWAICSKLYTIDVILCAWLAGVLLIGGCGYYWDGKP